MEIQSPNFIRNYFLEKFLSARLYFMREKSELTNFLEQIKGTKNILIILPRDRAEEIIARKVSTLDIMNLRDSDVNWLGVPNNFYMSKIINQHFELIIDLNSYHDTLCSYLAAMITAPLRIHFVQGKYDKIYNIQIRSDNDVSLEVRYNNFLNYLRRMRQSVAAMPVG
jgi:hypothetical protein